MTRSPTRATVDAHPPVRRAARRRTSAQTVTVCGWVARRREHGEHLAFVDVRDHPGVVQCVVDNAIDVRSEYVVRITGIVRDAPGGHRQRRTCRPARSRSATARSRCCARPTPPPFPIDARADEVDENVRLQYRYLDLRRERMQRNLRVRGAVNSADPPGDGGAGLRRGRDADARAVDARRAPASSSCRRARSRARSTPCRSRRSCSSSC